MKTDAPRVAAAKIEAERAKAQFFASLQALEAPVLRLKDQLTPSHIMKDLVEGAKNKGADLAENAVDAVRSRPLTAGAVVTAITLFLAREPLMDLAGKLTDKGPGKPARKRTKKSTENAE